MSQIPHNWIPRNNRSDISRGQISGYSNVFSSLLKARKLNTKKEVEAFLDPALSDMYDPFLLPGIESAVQRIKKSIKGKERILLFGDYDADGIISASIIYGFFRSFGIDPEIYIPDRISEGYDLGLRQVKSFCGKKDLVICVDCGTNNLETREYVISNPSSPEVIAFDHHNPTLADYNTDDRYIIVNPKLPGSDYPFGDLSGGGVSFKALIALLRSLNPEEKKLFSRDYLNRLLDMVAISTLADLMPLVDENRIMVSKGIDMIQNTSNRGLRRLIEISLPGKENITEYDIGFILAPRLNAAGRVKDALSSFRLLTEDGDDNSTIALELDSFNQQRQKMQKDTLEEIINRYNPSGSIPREKIFIEYSSHWNEGILGIVASDMVKAFNIPVILLRERDGLLKGSGRSIPEFSLHGSLKKFKDLFIRFGGHDQACGITMELSNFEEFRRRMRLEADEALTPDDIIKKYYYDMELDLKQINKGLIGDIQKLRPFGKGNPRPSFITRDCTIKNIRLLKEGRHMKLSLYKGSMIQEGIKFNIADEKASLPQAGSTFDILYELGINSWMGRDTIQLVIKDMFQKN